MLRMIGIGKSRCVFGNVEVTVDGNAIEMVALDECNHPKPNSYVLVKCDNSRIAHDRVFTAGVIYEGLWKENRQQAAEEAFRAIRGGYDNR